MSRLLSEALSRGKGATPVAVMDTIMRQSTICLSGTRNAAEEEKQNLDERGFPLLPFCLETQYIEHMSLFCTWEHILPTHEFPTQIYP